MSSTCSKGCVSLLESIPSPQMSGKKSLQPTDDKRFLWWWLSGGSSKIDGWGEPFAEVVDQRSLIKWSLKERWTQVGGFSL